MGNATLRDASENGDGSVISAAWTLTTADHTGTPIRCPEWFSKSAQFVGASTWGSSTVTVEGSNDGVNYVALNDDAGDSVAVVADGLISIPQFAILFLRPRLSVAGTAASVVVTIAALRPNPLRQ